MHKELSLKRVIIWISIFGIAMAFLESAVVVYLRKIYYPFGFNFPLAPIENSDAIIELFRELVTIIMLLSISYISGKTLIQRFAFFIYTFAVWDIFYYIFLYLLVGWPSSLMTWDILFLIPVTWVGPVITPLIVSLTMIGLAILIFIRESQNNQLYFNAYIWSIFILGAIGLVVAFTWDYSKYILENFTVKEIWSLPDNKALFDIAHSYVPRKFNWFLFILGELIIISGIIILSFRKSPRVD